MSIEEYLKKVREILRQYDEGAVTDVEAFNAIVFYAHGVAFESKD